MSSALSSTLLGTLLPRELGAGSRAPRAAGRSSRTLDAAPSSPILDCRRSPEYFSGLRPSRFFWLVLTKPRLVESCGGPIPPAIYPVWLFTRSGFFLQSPRLGQGGQALNQQVGGLTSTKVRAGLPGVRTGGAAFWAWRSCQYRSTAKRRAMATFATWAPRRNFKR
jgi:hypothetical protein